MGFLTEYGVFLAEAVTVIVAVLVLVAGIMGLVSKNKTNKTGHLKVKKMNTRLDELKESMEDAIFTDDFLKQQKKQKKKAKKAEKKNKSTSPDIDEKQKSRIYVIDFKGDIKASANTTFREAITSILQVANPVKDEVVVRLESGGGMVHSYGLASAQMDRIKQRNIKLTVCVDKVAASGGYMMACVADKIIASPFAVIGSIGVVAQLPNFSRLLKKNDIDFEMFTAGEYKRTVTMFAENTDKGREKFKDDLEDTHELFKGYVSEHRPAVDIAKVANGDVWFGKRAKDVNLVDELMTSDEYILQSCQNADVYEVGYEQKKTLPERMGLAAEVALERLVMKLIGSSQSARFFQ